jgi:molybdate transport system ATP-binding protein
MIARSDTEFAGSGPLDLLTRYFRRSNDLAVPSLVPHRPHAAEAPSGNAGELVADFEKRFPGGPLVRIQMRESFDDFSLTVLFGPSGSGKTTALRCLAGLECPDRGLIRFGDETWFDSERRIFVPPQRRRIGYLFQDYALFPHLTIVQNIRYGLRRVGKTERLRRVTEMMDLLGLRGLENRYPRQVSGGQQQRVALARALVYRPRLLLLDEPLSAMDVPTRGELRRQLRQWLGQLRMPGILVTHDRIEALALGDHLVVLDAGKVRQRGEVHEVFTRPADLGVAQIVGVDTVERAMIQQLPDGLARVDIGAVQLVALSTNGISGEAYVCIHAEDVVLEKNSSPTQSSARNHLIGRIQLLDREGAVVRVTLDCGFPLKALVTKQSCREMALQQGDEIIAAIKAGAIHVVPRGGASS